VGVVQRFLNFRTLATGSLNITGHALKTVVIGTLSPTRIKAIFCSKYMPQKPFQNQNSKTVKGFMSFETPYDRFLSNRCPPPSGVIILD